MLKQTKQSPPKCSTQKTHFMDIQAQITISKRKEKDTIKTSPKKGGILPEVRRILHNNTRVCSPRRQTSVKRTTLKYMNKKLYTTTYNSTIV